MKNQTLTKEQKRRLRTLETLMSGLLDYFHAKTFSEISEEEARSTIMEMTQRKRGWQSYGDEALHEYRLRKLREEAEAERAPRPRPQLSRTQEEFRVMESLTRQPNEPMKLDGVPMVDERQERLDPKPLNQLEQAIINEKDKAEKLNKPR
jgi:hypothetical protein